MAENSELLKLDELERQINFDPNKRVLLPYLAPVVSAFNQAIREVAQLTLTTIATSARLKMSIDETSQLVKEHQVSLQERRKSLEERQQHLEERQQQLEERQQHLLERKRQLKEREIYLSLSSEEQFNYRKNKLIDILRKYKAALKEFENESKDMPENRDIEIFYSAMLLSVNLYMKTHFEVQAYITEDSRLELRVIPPQD